MGVLLGLGDAQLGLATLLHDLAQGVVEVCWREGRGRGNIRGILGQHDQAIGGQRRAHLTAEAVEVLEHEGAGQLAGAVGAEIQEQHGVAVLGSDRLAVRAHAGGGDEFVGLATFVGGVEAGFGALGLVLAMAFGDQAVGFLDAVPAVVAVHGEVATDDRGDEAVVPTHQLGELGVGALDRGPGALGRGVAAVEEAVQVDALGAPARGHLGYCQQVILVAVDATGRQQAEQVDRLARLHRRVDGGGQHGIVVDLAVLDGLGDTGEVLVDDAPGAEVHVADLGVTHLTVRQTHVAAIGVDQGVWALLPQAVHVGGVGGGDGVGRCVFVVSIAVEDDQRHRARCGRSIRHEELPLAQDDLARHPFFGARRLASSPDVLGCRG